MQIKIHEDDSKTVKQQVQEGVLDMGVVMMPVDEKEFEIVPFVRDELCLFVHKSHPLASRDYVELKELEHEQFILIKQKLYHDLIVQSCIDAGFRPEVAFESSEWEFISGLISENLGVSIFPRPMTNQVNSDCIKAIRIINPTLPWHLGLVTKRKKNPSPAIRAFSEYISHNFPFST